MLQAKKLVLPLNILLFNLTRLIPLRDKHLWVFGALEGRKYDDNSKCMFEYMIKEHGNVYNCVWLTNNEDTIRLLRESGAKAYLNRSMKGKWMQLRAGVAFYTHGLMDFGLFPLLGGAEIVALWHGMGFKHIYNGKYTGWKLKAKRLVDHFFSWTYRTITPVTSNYSVDWVQRMFTLNPKNIYITGQPRNDVFKSVDRNRVLQSIGIDIAKKVVVYMPTYRHVALGADAMDRIVNNLYNSKTLSEALDKHQFVFLVKLHPLTPHINLSPKNNFMILNYSDVFDNQQLMGACDVLVTDYSSCFVDYALLRHPLIFYTPDIDEFFAKSEKLDDDYLKIAHKNMAVTVDELANKIIEHSLAAVDATNEIFEDVSIKDTCYSENVYKIIVEKIANAQTRSN